MRSYFSIQGRRIPLRFVYVNSFPGSFWIGVLVGLAKVLNLIPNLATWRRRKEFPFFLHFLSRTEKSPNMDNTRRNKTHRTEKRRLFPAFVAFAVPFLPEISSILPSLEVWMMLATDATTKGRKNANANMQTFQHIGSAKGFSRIWQVSWFNYN